MKSLDGEIHYRAMMMKNMITDIIFYEETEEHMSMH